MRDTRRFALIPLSPFHVGTGHTIAPEEYLHDGDTLIRINLPALMQNLTPEDRGKVEEALDKNDLKYARSIIQARARDARFHLYRIPVGLSSRNDLTNLFHNPDRPRSGEVHLLPRNPYSGAPCIPGSSIKGAIRTAMLNHALNHQSSARSEEIRSQVLDSYERNAPSHRSPALLESLAFERRISETEWDPLRALALSDVSFESADARIDRVFVRYRSGDEQQASGIQMHYERIRSQADGGVSTPGTVSITIDTDALKALPMLPKYGGRKLWPMLPEGTDPWVYLQFACNTFYHRRLSVEWTEFVYLQSQATGGPHWLPASMEGIILLRIGRFSHFDSLSVDELRRGWNVQKRMPIEGLGATRTLCELADGRRKAPMGWVLLKPLPTGATA